MTTSEMMFRTTDSVKETMTDEGFIGVATTQTPPITVEGSRTPESATDGKNTVEIARITMTLTPISEEVSTTVTPRAVSTPLLEELGSGQISATSPANTITEDFTSTVVTETASKTSTPTTGSRTEIITEEGFIVVGTTSSSPISLEGSGIPDTMTTAAGNSSTHDSYTKGRRGFCNCSTRNNFKSCT